MSIRRDSSVVFVFRYVSDFTYHSDRGQFEGGPFPSLLIVLLISNSKDKVKSKPYHDMKLHHLQGKTPCCSYNDSFHWCLCTSAHKVLMSRIHLYLERHIRCYTTSQNHPEERLCSTVAGISSVMWGTSSLHLRTVSTMEAVQYFMGYSVQQKETICTMDNVQYTRRISSVLWGIFSTAKGYHQYFREIPSVLWRLFSTMKVNHENIFWYTPSGIIFISMIVFSIYIFEHTEDTPEVCVEQTGDRESLMTWTKHFETQSSSC